MIPNASKIPINTKLTRSYEQVVHNAPAVSALLIKYLDTVFAPPEIKPSIPNMSEHLIFQHGIDTVKNHLRRLNDAQEADARTKFAEGEIKR